MPLERDFALSLILALRNVHAVLCHLFRCFDPRFKEKIHCHLALIIRGFNSCRKGYAKGRLKSRESDRFNILNISITKHSAIYHMNLDVQRLPPSNLVFTSCIVTRLVLLNIDKDVGMFLWWFCEKSVSYNTYNSDSSSWILNRLVNSCWYLWWRKWDGKEHSL